MTSGHYERPKLRTQNISSSEKSKCDSNTSQHGGAITGISIITNYRNYDQLSNSKVLFDLKLEVRQKSMGKA